MGLLNGFNAFSLNVIIYMAIRTASGLEYALAGVIKDISIIVGSAIFFGSAVSAIQVFGYTVALAGLQAYAVVSKAPAEFEKTGLISGLWDRFKSRPDHDGKDQTQMKDLEAVQIPR